MLSKSSSSNLKSPSSLDSTVKSPDSAAITIVHPSTLAASAAQCNVYIASLPRALDDVQLTSICAPYGEVISARIMREKCTHESKGYGFVLFRKPEEAASAVANLNGCLVNGYKIQVRPATLEASHSFTTVAEGDKTHSGNISPNHSNQKQKEGKPKNRRHGRRRGSKKSTGDTEKSGNNSEVSLLSPIPCFTPMMPQLCYPSMVPAALPPGPFILGDGQNQNFDLSTLYNVSYSTPIMNLANPNFASPAFF
ncbi:hypothetical protein AGDE_16360 [Angomonas deanei]|uniref:RNA recognition motif. (A.k.a. RRM, RBD, or RNP domain), putative n=1 Tax=Angomonas deanei TaxID=59799 RepID=A0A7G2CW38_9TRYP|nr:hypothetical protein AGDE_16360 [Angomonas deanei]CAD2222643.1 RNA recognition motif. (a.k.a. RRM, RBD, or RNP domain), putative [Angomonas deanei]|eukprot:EPY17225.1 hypothetical protein AGDE_16360 [Angomonas deanei]